MVLFNPPIKPSSDSSKSVAVRIKRSDFGDGYSQRSGDGLNTIKRNYPLVWNSLKVSQADAIEAFLEQHEGYKNFTWIPPRETVALKFICTEWKRGYSGGDSDTITATFEQVFDL